MKVLGESIMKGKRFFVTFAVAVLGLGLLVAPALVSAEPIEIKVGSYQPQQNPTIQYVAIPFCAEVERRTHYKVKFKWYHGGSLVKAHQAWDAVKSGLVDMVPTGGVWTRESQFPVSRVLTLPFLFDSSVQINMVYQKAFETIPELRKEYDGVKILAFHGSDLGNFSLVKPPPKTLADYKGLKLWAGTKTAVDIIQLLGGTPRRVELSDLYMSLQRKALDGILFPTSALAAYKFTDVVNNHTVIKATFGQIPLTFNLNKWNSLPPDVRSVIEEMAPSWTQFMGAIVDNRRVYLFKQLKKRGDKIYYPSPKEMAIMRKAVQPVYDKWMKDMESKGIDGQRILREVKTLVEEYKDFKYQPAAWWGNNWKK